MPPPKCPHCNKTIDDALEEEERKEMEDASPSGRLKILNRHMGLHAGGLRGCRPSFPMDHCYRSRGLLHRRMNVVSNCCAATFLRLPFDEKKRIAANEHLEKHKMLWRVPEKSGKRAKTISAGNDARRFVTNPAICRGLIDIFYDEVTRAEAATELEKLRQAALDNEVMQGDEPAPKQHATQRARTQSTTKGRKSPIGVQSAGVGKKAGKKKEAVRAVVLTAGAKKVTKQDVKAYAKKRLRESTTAGTDQADPAPAPAAAAQPSAAPAAALPAADAVEHDLDEEADNSMEVEDDEMPELEEDEQVGGLCGGR